MRHLIIPAGLLLLVQAFHLASLQDSTNSPGRTIDKGWLRELTKNTAGSQNDALAEEAEDYQGGDAMESGTDYSGGIPSGAMVSTSEEDDVTGRRANETSDDLNILMTTLPPSVQNGTTEQPESPNATVSSLTTTTTDPANSNQVNATEAGEEFNSTTTPQNSTGILEFTESPESNATTTQQQPATTPGGNTEMTNSTESANTTTASAATTTAAPPEMTNSTESANTTTTSAATTTAAPPEMTGTPAASTPTTVSSSETTGTSPATTTAAAPVAPEGANKTGESESSGSSAERGLASDTQRSRRQGAWGAVLGTAVAVAFVGLVAYVILRKKHQKGFSHRKLVEEFPSDPVLRLDNTEPLDLNFGGSAYYNPGLQDDNIQMDNIAGRR